jgi:hypothetical protein
MHSYDKEIVTIFPDGTQRAEGLTRRTPARSVAHQLSRDIVDWTGVILSLALMLGTIAGLVSLAAWAFGVAFWRVGVGALLAGGLMALFHDR